MKIIISMLLLVSLASCLKPDLGNGEEQHSHTHANSSHHSHDHGDAHMHDHGDGHTHSHHNDTAIDIKDMASYGFIKLKDHYFKLVPDVSQTEESHIDFYFKDSEAKHVSEAEIKLTLTAPDLSKEEFMLSEDKTGEHYQTKTMLKTGKYKVVVQVKKDGEVYNPRFEFEV